MITTHRIIIVSPVTQRSKEGDTMDRAKAFGLHVNELTVVGLPSSKITRLLRILSTNSNTCLPRGETELQPLEV